jgi:hypothetical protein
MKSLNTLLAAGSAVAMLSLAPMAVHAQAVEGVAVDTSAAVSPHGDWTLKQREDWLYNRLDKARDDGSVNSAEFDRVHHEMDRIRDDENRQRDDHDGQLTDNETTMLEARLDNVAGQIHWLHEDAFRRPW